MDVPRYLTPRKHQSADWHLPMEVGKGGLRDRAGSFFHLRFRYFRKKSANSLQHCQSARQEGKRLAGHGAGAGSENRHRGIE